MMSLLRITSRLVLTSHTPAILRNQTQRDIHRYVLPTLAEIRRRKKAAGPQPVPKRSEFIDWNYNAEIFAFGVRLKEKFTPALLQQAFVDRSFIVQEEMKQRAVGIEEPNLQLTENTQLIKKGEELMTEYIITYLNLSLPKFPRDGIKAIYQHLVSEKTLAHVSSHLGTKDLILTAEFPVSEQTLASSFKALVGALFESSGEAKAFEFIRDFVVTQLNQVDINEFWEIDNHFELLNEICKDKKLGEPEPRLISEVGKNTLLAVYQVGIYCNKRMIGSGFGEDATIATEDAAKDSLRNFFQTNTNMRPFDFKMPVEAVIKALSKPSVASVDKF